MSTLARRQAVTTGSLLGAGAAVGAGALTGSTLVVVLGILFLVVETIG